jgi:hypothetical protein
VLIAEKNLKAVQMWLQQSPSVCLRKLASQIEMAYTSTWRAVGKLRLCPYHVRAVQELNVWTQHSDYTTAGGCSLSLRKMEQTCLIRFISVTKSGSTLMDTQRVGTAGYGHVKIHMNYVKNPYMHKKLVYSMPCLAGAYLVPFHLRPVDSDIYKDIITWFISMLEHNEHHCWLQQNGATFHTSNETMNLLKEFDNHPISKGQY